jgi:hypothetical protein
VRCSEPAWGRHTSSFTDGLTSTPPATNAAIRAGKHALTETERALGALIEADLSAAEKNQRIPAHNKTSLTIARLQY